MNWKEKLQTREADLILGVVVMLYLGALMFSAFSTPNEKSIDVAYADTFSGYEEGYTQITSVLIFDQDNDIALNFSGDDETGTLDAGDEVNEIGCTVRLTKQINVTTVTHALEYARIHIKLKDGDSGDTLREFYYNMPGETDNLDADGHDSSTHWYLEFETSGLDLSDSVDQYEIVTDYDAKLP